MAIKRGYKPANEAIWYLRHYNFFPCLNEEDLMRMATSANMVRAPKGKVIYFPDEVADSIYLIKEGHVRLSRLTSMGRRLTLDILKPGEIFGEMTVLGEDTRQEMAEAQDDCLLCIVPKSYLSNLISQNPVASLHISKLIGLRRRRIENKIEDTLFYPVSVRLARLILRLADEYPGRTNLGHRLIRLRLTHQEIADLIGANRERVSSVLSRMHDEGLIRPVHRLFSLHNEEALKSMAMGEPSGYHFETSS